MSRAEFYRLVSGAINRVVVRRADDGPMTLEVITVVERELEATFAGHNSKFDATRFRRDCGL